MRKQCPHNSKDIKIMTENWTDHHPYGEDTHTSSYLRCSKCGLSLPLQAGYLNKQIYEEFTKRKVNHEEMLKLFNCKKSNWIFHLLNDGTFNYLKKENVLDKKIKNKLIMIKKLTQELEILEEKKNKPWLR